MNSLAENTNTVSVERVRRLFMNHSEVEPGVVSIRLEGRLDIRGVPLVVDKFQSIIAAQNGPIIVDLGGVELMNSVGLGMLIEGALSLKEGGSRMVLVNLHPRVEKVVRIARVEQLIPIACDMDDALAIIKMAA